MIKTTKHTCMHCERPFVFNDELRYFSQKPVHSFQCDICEEMNYLTDQESNPLWLILTLIFGLLALLPFLGALLYFFGPLIFYGQGASIIFLIVPILGLIVTSALLNVIYRNYVWKTHSLSPKFKSPFLDNLNRPTK